uniref:Xaa-Pro aminopeptidase 1-like n=1 Tax=Dermatophagoides pteronyssinus TaxID=6956 RepID=A0A6P6XNU4_DERPT|nr:xaa-Pro aminopeptidase 1-like [Dermatophagoides pteronyssinus]
MRFNNLMESSSACSYVATQRGGVALLYEGHRYNKVRDGKDGTVYWRCSRDRQCPGRAVTVNNRNLASSNFANNNNNNNSSHSLLPSNNNNNNNLPFINQSSVNDNFSQAMNLSLPNTNNVDNNNTLYSSLNNQFNLINNQQNILESSFKMKTNSRTPPPPSASNLLSHHHHNHQLMNKSSYHQYNKLLRNNKYSSSSSQQQQQQQQNASKNNNPFDALNRLALSNSPLNTHSSSSSSSMMINMKSNDSPTSRPSSTSSFSMLNTTPTVNDMASNTITCQTTDPLTIQLQDAFQEAHAAAFAAAAFPSLLNETFKFLSATAATNPQMAAALAQTLYNQNLLKNFDLTMATATAAAVVAASNNNNNNNNENQSDRSIDKCQLNHLSIDHSPFVSLGDNFRSDLDTNFYRRQQQQDQPLNMAVRDKTNILKVLRALMRSAGIQSSDNNAINSEASFHALVVPTSDSHGSEYIAPCDARRQFITDFTGSAGTAVITLNEAALWTDGRYFLQAERELNKQHWILMKQYQPNTPTIGEWLNKVLTPGSRVGVDAHTMSYDLWIKLEQELLLCGNQLIQTPFNLIDQIWTWRPERPFEPVIPLEMKFAGKSFNDKLIEIREKMLKKDAALLVLTALDDIAWLFNLRGSDIDYNPVFFSYAIVSMNRAYLFIDESKLNENSLKHLGINDDDDNNQNNLKSPSTSTSSTRSSPSVRSTNNNNVQQSPQSMIIEKENESTDDPMSSMFVIEIHPYESINEFIRSFVSLNPRDKIWISNKSNYALVNLIPESRRILTGVSPVCCLKAIKNQIELDGMRRAHIKDAVALCELFAWIEDEVKNNNNNNSNGGNNNNTKKQTSNDSKNDIEITDPLSPNSQTSSSSSSSSSTSSSSSSTTKKSCQLSTTAVVDELNVDIKLEELRRKQKDYVGPSFETIAGSGPNSAIIHYKSTEETNRPITMNEMFLLDCGAQFRDGTTDVTRTIHLGQPSAYEKECFTRVLKGHISLAQCRFPRLTKGQFLDAYARRSLWDVGLDYNHGTGHGVGMFLNVHEPPIGISNRINMDDPGLDEHMILSNEPGFYEPNQFGIRIESLVVTKKDNLKYNFNERGYLGFETITLVPIQTKLLDINLLTLDEIKWINDYHQQCRDIVGKELEKQGQIRALEWLLRETSPITVDK